MSSLKEQIKSLLALQDIDNHIAVLRQEKEDSPKRVAELEDRQVQQKALLEQARAEQQELETRRLELERKIEDNERRMRRSQNRVSEVKNVRQHKAIIKEMEDMRMFKQDWEEELLKVMDSLEAANSRVETAARVMK
ncbi:MAG: hypothetical protein JRJ59_05320, partial [Deltaproteobacteria bacterium]|nr:hypothetical protein [Deltaproteobacteria bacterium]